VRARAPPGCPGPLAPPYPAPPPAQYRPRGRAPHDADGTVTVRRFAIAQNDDSYLVAIALKICDLRLDRSHMRRALRAEESAPL
jgi:hypothetical protein